MAAWITAYLLLKSRNGTNSRRMYSLKATKAPMLTTPSSTSPPPYQSSSAMLNEPAASTMENSDASYTLDCWMASRWARLRSSNSRKLRACRLKSWITAMPGMASPR